MKAVISGEPPARLSFRKRIARGLTLVEAAMVLAVATMVVAGVMIFFQSASMNNKTNEAMGQLADIQQIVRSITSNQPDYASVSTAGLIASNGLPVKMISGTSVKHAFGGYVVVSAANHNGGQANAFAVSFRGVPSSACSKMAAFDLGRGMVFLGVSQGRINYNTLYFSQSTGITDNRRDPVSVSQACNTAGGTVTMLWYFI